MLTIGNATVTDVRAGSDHVIGVYVGDTLVWPTDTVNVWPTSSSMPASVTSATFSVSSNASWTTTLVGSPSWATIISGATGSGDGAIQIAVENNFNSTSTRSVEVLVEAGMVSDSSLFEQRGVIIDLATQYTYTLDTFPGGFPGTAEKYNLNGTTLLLSYYGDEGSSYFNEINAPANGLISGNIIRIYEAGNPTVGYAARIASVVAHSNGSDMYHTVTLTGSTVTPGFDPLLQELRGFATYAMY